MKTGQTPSAGKGHRSTNHGTKARYWTDLEEILFHQWQKKRNIIKKFARRIFGKYKKSCNLLLIWRHANFQFSTHSNCCEQLNPASYTPLFWAHLVCLILHIQYALCFGKKNVFKRRIYLFIYLFSPQHKVFRTSPKQIWILTLLSVWIAHCLSSSLFLLCMRGHLKECNCRRACVSFVRDCVTVSVCACLQRGCPVFMPESVH